MGHFSEVAALPSSPRYTIQRLRVQKGAAEPPPEHPPVASLLVTHAAGDARSCSFGKLKPDAALAVRVAASNARGCGAFSDWAIVATEGNVVRCDLCGGGGDGVGSTLWCFVVAPSSAAGGTCCARSCGRNGSCVLGRA